MPERKKGRLWVLFWTMAKIGLAAFGGGWGVISMMEEKFCDELGWFSREELLDYVALGRSFPGIMIMNISAVFGYRTAGVPGAFVACGALALPSILVIALLTLFYDQIRNTPWVDRALVGVRAAVVPIVLSAMAKLRSSALTGPWTWAAAIGAALLCRLAGMSSVTVVLGGVALGLLAGTVLKRRDRHVGGN